MHASDLFSWVVRNDQETIFQIIQEAHTMITAMGGILVAIIGENHTGLQFATKHPFVFQILCAAHSTQVPSTKPIFVPLFILL